MNTSHKIVIAGGSGYLGQYLSTHYAQKGWKVVILSRTPHPSNSQVKHVLWDGKTKGAWVNTLEGATILINLAGKSVDCRYTEKNKAEIYDSRINATHVLGEAVKQLQNPPEVFINASSATIYRHAEDKAMDEFTGEMGAGFSVDVCEKWEKTFTDITMDNVRKIILRIAIVLGKDGGAMKPLSLLTKAGLGGKQGSGQQYMSWIHEEDFAKIIDFLLVNQSMKGIYNVSAPNPVPNGVFMQRLRKFMRVPFGLPAPSWLLSIGAFMLRTEPELVLKSRRVVPKRLLEAGYNFQYKTVDQALYSILVPDTLKVNSGLKTVLLH